MAIGHFGEPDCANVLEWLYTEPFPMQQLNLKPTHKLVKDYYEVLGQFGQLNVDHEMAVRSAFQNLLAGCGHQFDLTLVPEYPFQPPRLNPVRIDGALLNPFRLARGYWEAKDEHDDLEKEIRSKLDKGYPRTNIIFQAPERAVLFQHGVRQGTNEDIGDPKNLVELLKQFFAYREPHIEEWDEAVAEFKDRIPEIAKAVAEKIEEQRRTNPAFVERFDAFYEICRQSINPNLSVHAVEEMLVQHLLTERIFRRIFDNPDFSRRNVIAVEIEKVIDSMTRREFSRDAFLKDLDRFYKAIELAAENAETYKQKQEFLNTVYERFFQGYSPKEADTHGIVYTPQPIVDFMVRSVEDILKKEFGRSLSDKGVHILDPFVGTGNFITRVMKEIRTSALPYKYENELHCNEVMLLPYYIASMNIEHEYMERTGEYKAFPGICLVDTFELAEPEQSQLSFMSEENTARVKRQKEAPIFVIIGNPPYNAWQVNENDNNKNRKYQHLDRKIADTYRAKSAAGLTIAVNDPYVKAFRWASDRIGLDGVVAFVSNDSFIDQRAFDSMRKHLSADFDSIYILDLGGNVRKNPKLSGTTHNVFGIQVGVSITLLVRQRSQSSPSKGIYYARTDEWWRREQKYEFLDSASGRAGVSWAQLFPDERQNWITEGLREEFGGYLQLGGNLQSSDQNNAIFNRFSNGIKTNRDTWVYNSNKPQLSANVSRMIDTYNEHVSRWRREQKPAAELDGFVSADEHQISWSGDLKAALVRGEFAKFSEEKIRVALYRPFDQNFLYLDRLLNNSVYQIPRFFPTIKSETENIVIGLTGPGSEKPFMALSARHIIDLHLTGAGCTTQCFPFYTYDEDGSNHHENITDWSLNDFRTHYNDANITKWDIFHYVYAVLHHPDYRERYAANLKRELPRIPYVSDFRAFVESGRLLAELHVNYEQQREYALERVEKGRLRWRVEKMRLSKDKTSLIYNGFLTLNGIPPETYEYRLGNRSALEWIINQYQVSIDKRSGIVNDPNRADDPEYIVRLIGQVIAVSLETMTVVKGLPELDVAAEDSLITTP
jgi:predicted helicase